MGKTNCLVDVSALELLFNIEANSASEKTMNYFCIGICLCYSYTNYTGSPESEKKWTATYIYCIVSFIEWKNLKILSHDYYYYYLKKQTKIKLNDEFFFHPIITHLVSTISLLVRLLLYSVEMYSVRLSHETFLLWWAVLYDEKLVRSNWKASTVLLCINKINLLNYINFGIPC